MNEYLSLTVSSKITAHDCNMWRRIVFTAPKYQCHGMEGKTPIKLDFIVRTIHFPDSHLFTAHNYNNNKIIAPKKL